MPQIDYLQVVVLLLCMSWFVKGARMDMRSPLLWGALSLGMWLVFTQLLGYGIFGGVFSQLLLIAGLAGWEEVQERRRQTEAGQRAQAKTAPSAERPRRTCPSCPSPSTRRHQE